MEKHVPSLLFLCVKYMNFFQKKLLEKFLCGIRLERTLIYAPNAHMRRFFHMISIIKYHVEKHQAYNYGGYIRDQVAKRFFRDIDICFPSRQKFVLFREDLKKDMYFSISDVRKSYTRGGTIRVSDMGTIQISGHEIGCSVCLDINYSKKTNHSTELARKNASGLKVLIQERRDFDVNCLAWYGETRELKLTNPHCVMSDVIRNCKRKQLVMLDADSRPSIVHKRRNQCIDANSVRGQKLLARMEKMKRRGWRVLNEPCRNPNCIMATKETIQLYQQTKARTAPRRQCNTNNHSSFVETEEFMSTKLVNTISFERKWRA